MSPDPAPDPVLAAFSHLHVWERAPHTPSLVLLILGRWVRGDRGPLLRGRTCALVPGDPRPQDGKGVRAVTTGRTENKTTKPRDTPTREAGDPGPPADLPKLEGP
jgi:hypothetical protein